MTSQKLIAEQKILQILQSCKQIPKDDRLTLRKLVKEGNDELKTILLDASNKKLQVKLRKFIQKLKQAKKDQNCAIRQITCVQNGRKSKEDLAHFYCRMATKSLQKSHGLNSPNPDRVRQFKQHLQQFRSLRSSFSQSSLQKPSGVLRNVANKITTPKQARLDLKTSPHINDINANAFINTVNTSPKYSITQNYLKEENVSLYTPAEILRWEPLKSPLSFSAVSITPTANLYANLNSNVTSYSNSGIATPTSYSSPKYKPAQLNQLFKKIRQSVSSISAIPQNQQAQSSNNSHDKNIYLLKSTLIKYYAEDIYDFIVQKYFSLTSSINQKSVYLPYRQFLNQLQTYFNSRDQSIQIIRQNDIKVVLFEPFTNQYESVDTKNLGTFLNKYCLHRNNQIRNLFILLNCTQGSMSSNNSISVEKFKRINSWKGEQLISAFEKLVKKWGQNGSISYWQMYRVKQQKQYINFNSLYSRC